MAYKMPLEFPTASLDISSWGGTTTRQHKFKLPEWAHVQLIIAASTAVCSRSCVSVFVAFLPKRAILLVSL